MELKEYLRILRQRWLSVLAIVVATAVVAFGYSMLSTPRFSATSQLFVAVQGNDSVVDLNQGNAFATSRVTSYVLLATSPRVLQAVADDLGLDKSVLAGQITAGNPAKSVLIDITVVDTDPSRAAAVANSLAAALIAVVKDIENVNIADPAGPATQSAPVGLTKVQDAIAPTSPFEPNIVRNLSIGVLLGLLLGIAVAILIEVLDTRLRGRGSVEKLTDLSVLGAFEANSSDTEQLILGSTAMFSRRAESYRQLRTHLQFANVDGGTSSVLVTSSIPGEGKSTTAANLAIVLAESDLKVLLVDADLRRPRQDQMFGIEGSVGLTTVLTGRIALSDAVQPIGGAGQLSVLTSGALPPNPSEILGSAAMERALREMEDSFDIVVIDTPPLINVSDPAVLSTLVSGVLLVSSVNGMLHRDQLRQSLENLSLVRAKVIGVILNRVQSGRAAHEYYEYGSLDESDEVVKHRPWKNKKRVAKRKAGTDTPHSAAPGLATTEILRSGVK